eukprot:8431098-Alexandrium_andersonii.AAC.1
MPVGVGSGRADLRYKVHALLHSQRLSTESWADAVCLLNSTFSWTGDLGTEARLPRVRVELADLFPWACPAPSVGGAGDDSLDGFAFEPEAGADASGVGAAEPAASSPPDADFAFATESGPSDNVDV